MKKFFREIEKKYLKLFFLRSKLLSTIIFMPLLYIFGWILASPLLLIGLDKDDLSLTGTIFTFLIFIISLPKWFEIRWGLKNTWTSLGINKINRNRNFIFFMKINQIIKSIIVQVNFVNLPFINTLFKLITTCHI